MPLYTVHHSAALTEAHKDGIAGAITRIHAQLFVVPAAFVNVVFAEYASTPHYVAGKKRTGAVNYITGNVRPGATRTREQYEVLCRQINEAWTQVVGAAAAGEAMKLDGIFVLATITAVYEQGLMIPEAGQDKQWIEENLPEMRRRAEGGNEVIADMLKELGSREEFRGVLAAV